MSLTNDDAYHLRTEIGKLRNTLDAISRRTSGYFERLNEYIDTHHQPDTLLTSEAIKIAIEIIDKMRDGWSLGYLPENGGTYTLVNETPDKLRVGRPEEVHIVVDKHVVAAMSAAQIIDIDDDRTGFEMTVGNNPNAPLYYALTKAYQRKV